VVAIEIASPQKTSLNFPDDDDDGAVLVG